MIGYKTIIFASAVFLLGILQSAGFNDYLASLGMSGNGNLTMIIAGITAALRLVTVTPIFRGK